MTGESDDCGEREARMGLWGKGCKEGTEGKVMRREDCGTFHLFDKTDDD